MKLLTKLCFALLCLAMLLCIVGCGGQTPQATDPTEDTQPPADPRTVYTTARQMLNYAPNLQLVVSETETRTIGDTSYSQSTSSVISYAGLHTDAFSAVVEENLVFGSYENSYKTFFLNGTAYADVMDYTFSHPMTAEEFISGQTPAILLDATLYGTITKETTLAGTMLYFSDPSALEYWVTKPAEVELISAEGSALINKAGMLLSSAYSAQYKIGQTEYSLSVTVTASAPVSMDLSDSYPPELEAATPISYFSAPRLLLQAVGSICATQNLSAEYTETLYCEAADSIRKQHVQVTAKGTGSDFSALVDYTATLTNYAGLSETNIQQETYENGAYTYSLNGSKPTVLQTVTVEQMRTYCEDTVLSALLSIDYLSNAVLDDDGDRITLQMTGTEAMAEDLCDSIYTMLNTDLDQNAQSYRTSRIGGYLTIDKSTGLPVEAGIYLTRIHVIGGASYTMTYELSETIALPVQ